VSEHDGESVLVLLLDEDPTSLLSEQRCRALAALILWL